MFSWKFKTRNGVPQLRIHKLVVTSLKWGVVSLIYTNYPALFQQVSTDNSDHASSLENLMKEEWFLTTSSLSCFTDLLAELAL
jgi:hypothetical protein